MKQRIGEIYRAFDGRLVGNPEMKFYICELLAEMPEKIVRFVTKNCWFLGSTEDAWAFVFKGNDLKNQFLIFISDELLNQDEGQIRYSIAHEIGHVINNHDNSANRKQTKREIRKQEKEADEFAKRYTQNTYYNRDL